jgi:tRNA-specific 2-thiouridylase
MPTTRIFVGLSGGVDSSVAASLLLEQGFEVHGVFMKNWEDNYEVGYCTSDEDLEDARAVCETLDIPLHQVNFTIEYRERVFHNLLNEYRSGRTPNPDTLCNTEIKFRAFLEHARRLGADRIATGHYARSIMQDEHWYLLKGYDDSKDQSYFLYGLNQEQLASTIFPVGDFSKAQVRAHAASAKLVTHSKKSSTGICFIGKRPFREFLSRYLPIQPGPIYSPEGTLLGEHNGLMFHTIGQRTGLGIGGQRNGSGEPWYVVGKDLVQNALVVAQGRYHRYLFHRQLQASKLQWIIGYPPKLPLRCHAKIRYRQPDQPCVLKSYQDANIMVCFDELQKAITPGQAVVFYSGDQCLGGGTIDLAFD